MSRKTFNAIILLCIAVVAYKGFRAFFTENTPTVRLNLPSDSTLFSTQKPNEVWVNSYERSDGTRVRGHYRTKSDSTVSNNWSTYPNVNPHTGKRGSRYR